MFQRVRTAAGVLLWNLPKIQSQNLSVFLYASKRCSSMSDHRLCLLVLEYPSSSLLDSESLIAGLLLRCKSPGTNCSDPLGSGTRSIDVVTACLRSNRQSRAIERRPGWVCQLKPVMRNECCATGLMVESTIFSTGPMLAMSRITELKETPRWATCLHPWRMVQKEAIDTRDWGPRRLSTADQAGRVWLGRALVRFGAMSALADRPLLKMVLALPLGWAVVGYHNYALPPPRVSPYPPLAAAVLLCLLPPPLPCF